MNKKEELDKIVIFLKQQYDCEFEVVNHFMFDYAINFKDKDYDYEMAIDDKDEKSFAPNNELIHFDFQARKNRPDLNYHGGGYAKIYNSKNYDEIVKFLENHNIKKQNQLSLF